MKTKGILLAVGLALAGLVTAVVLFSDSSKAVESTHQRVERASPSPSAPVVALAPPAATLETPATAALEVSEQRLVAEERSEVAAPVIRGRVVEAESRFPRPGIELQLKSRSEVIASDVTDAAGQFELPVSSSNRIAIELVEPEGWRAVRRRQRISDSGTSAQDLVFELRRDSSAVFHGRAIDESSGDPLPYLKLSVGSDFTGRGVETDGEGLFTSRQRYDAGQVEIALILPDGARWRNSERTIAFDGTTRVHDVPLPIGPTYFLQIATPPGYVLADLRAFLSDFSTNCPWTLTDDLREGEELHADVPPWVRFSQASDHRTEDGSTRLWVCTTDGRWLGSCQVPQRSQRSGGHQVTLTPCGALEVAEDADNDELRIGLEVKLRRPSGEECWGRRPGRVADGRYHFLLVPPGEYVLSVESNRTKPLERTVQVVAGDPTVVEIALELLPHGGTISGVVRSESGRFRVLNMVSLHSAEDRSADYHTSVEWKDEGGALVGHFAFEDLPVGEYELSAGGPIQFPCRASHTTIRPPAADVEFLCLDGGGGAKLEIEAFDASTDKPLTRFSASFGTELGRSHYSFSTNGSNRLELGRFPRDVSIDWEATCDGYVAVAGDVSSFQQVGTKDGEPILRARVGLQPGWGGRVLAYTKTERIAGAVVLCDNIEVGRTNERGELDLLLPARPQRFEVRHPDFVMHNPAAGQVPDDAAVLLCYMEPRE